MSKISAMRIVERKALFVPSPTNRGTSGGRFDIHWFPASLFFNQADGTFTLYAGGVKPCPAYINSDYDELGPYSYREPTTAGENVPSGSAVSAKRSLFMFGSDRADTTGLDLYVTGLVDPGTMIFDSASLPVEVFRG